MGLVGDPLSVRERHSLRIDAIEFGQLIFEPGQACFIGHFQDNEAVSRPGFVKSEAGLDTVTIGCKEFLYLDCLLFTVVDMNAE